MSFYEKWMDIDYNPFILFSAEGKVLSLNDSAQFLLGTVSAKTVFEYATAHASTSFGFKTTHLNLEFDRFKFFAICVGYEDESSIGIRLYKMPHLESAMIGSLHTREEPINIYTLIDLCISTNSIGKHFNLSKDFDPALPDLRINPDIFIKMLNAIFSSMKQQTTELTIKLSVKAGEYIKIEDKKYSILSIVFSSDALFDTLQHSKVNSYADKIGASVLYKEHEVFIDMALISG